MASTATTIKNGSLTYITIDVYTSPPTHVAVVMTDEDAAAATKRDPSVYLLSVEDVLPSKGWTDAQQQVHDTPHGFLAPNGVTLNICFLHAFGRCRGRSGNDATTCQQLHVKPDALFQLRSLYRLPVRTFFTRSFTAVVPPMLLAAAAWASPESAVDMPCRLEFLARDAAKTAGAVRVDADFRDQLMYTGPASNLRTLHLGLCLPSALGASCIFGDRCECLHVSLDATTTKLTRVQRQALALGVAQLASQAHFAHHLMTHCGVPAQLHSLLPPPPPPPPPPYVLSTDEEPTRPTVPAVVVQRSAPTTPPTAPGTPRTPTASSVDQTCLLSDLALFLKGSPRTPVVVG